jgi:hypothetical protein
MSAPGPDGVPAPIYRYGTFPVSQVVAHLLYTPRTPAVHTLAPTHESTHTVVHTVVARLTHAHPPPHTHHTHTPHTHTHTRPHLITSTHPHHPPTHTHLLTQPPTHAQLWLGWRRLALGMCSRFPHARPRPAPSADAAATNSPAAAGPAVRVGPRSASVPTTILIRYLTPLDQLKQHRSNTMLKSGYKYESCCLLLQYI